MKPYYETELGRLYHGDCLEIMPELEPVNLVVTSPPYDELRKYKGYVFNFEVTAQYLNLLIKKGGVIVWIVGDETKNGSETGNSFKQALFFKSIGLNLHDTMIWRKPNPIPTQSTRYEQSFEYMFILSNGKPTANLIRVPTKTKGQRKKHRARSDKHKDNNEGFYKYSMSKIKPNVWDIAIGGQGFDHPAIFPEALAHDHIISWSNDGDLLLDCFAGSGTTLKQAEKLNRRWIGIEIEEKYCEIAVKRIENERKQLKLWNT